MVAVGLPASRKSTWKKTSIGDTSKWKRNNQYLSIISSVTTRCNEIAPKMVNDIRNNFLIAPVLYDVPFLPRLGTCLASIYCSLLLKLIHVHAPQAATLSVQSIKSDIGCCYPSRICLPNLERTYTPHNVHPLTPSRLTDPDASARRRRWPPRPALARPGPFLPSRRRSATRRRSCRRRRGPGPRRTWPARRGRGPGRCAR